MADNDLGWVLDSEIGAVEGVRYAVLLSSDGLPMARTASIGNDEAEKFAAITAALRAAALAYDDFTGGGGVRQVLIEVNNHLGLITRAGENAMLTVQTTGPDADVGLIAHHMTLLAARLSHELRTGPRQTASAEQDRAAS